MGYITRKTSTLQKPHTMVPVNTEKSLMVSPLKWKKGANRSRKTFFQSFKRKVKGSLMNREKFRKKAENFESKKEKVMTRHKSLQKTAALSSKFAHRRFSVPNDFKASKIFSDTSKKPKNLPFDSSRKLKNLQSFDPKSAKKGFHKRSNSTSLNEDISITGLRIIGFDQSSVLLKNSNVHHFTPLGSTSPLDGDHSQQTGSNGTLNLRIVNPSRKKLQNTTCFLENTFKPITNASSVHESIESIGNANEIPSVHESMESIGNANEIPSVHESIESLGNASETPSVHESIESLGNASEIPIEEVLDQSSGNHCVNDTSSSLNGTSCTLDISSNVDGNTIIPKSGLESSIEVKQSLDFKSHELQKEKMRESFGTSHLSELYRYFDIIESHASTKHAILAKHETYSNLIKPLVGGEYMEEVHDALLGPSFNEVILSPSSPS